MNIYKHKTRKEKSNLNFATNKPFIVYGLREIILLKQSSAVIAKNLTTIIQFNGKFDCLP